MGAGCLLCTRRGSEFRSPRSKGSGWWETAFPLSLSVMGLCKQQERWEFSGDSGSPSPTWQGEEQALHNDEP